MRVALDSGSEVGQRAARIVLGDHRCTSLVMLNREWLPDDQRAFHDRDITDVDVVVSDGTTPLTSLIGRASVARVPVVVWNDAPESEFGPAAVPVIVGANVGSALVDALLTHPASMPGPDESVAVGWTEPGKALSQGRAMPFPEPIGMAWSEPRSEGRYVAYRDDEWAGATTIIDGPRGQRIVGVADLGAHLEAMTLVAVAVAALSESFGPGVQSPKAACSGILEAIRNLELDIAVWRSEP